MKLIYAIINNDDSHAVSKALTKAGYFVTKLASKGGFLMSGNTTFIIGSQDSEVDDIIEIIRKRSRQRRQFIPAVSTADMSISGAASIPLEVTVGGATVFVTDIERFEKL